MSILLGIHVQIELCGYQQSIGLRLTNISF